jgi:hypothetical protein
MTLYYYRKNNTFDLALYDHRCIPYNSLEMTYSKLCEKCKKYYNRKCGVYSNYFDPSTDKFKNYLADVFWKILNSPNTKNEALLNLQYPQITIKKLCEVILKGETIKMEIVKDE